MPIMVGILGRLRAVEQRDKGIIFSFESSDLVSTPLLPNVIRHTWRPTHWPLYAQRERLFASATSCGQALTIWNPERGAGLNP